MAKKQGNDPWQNRIVRYGTSVPDQLLSNPANFKIHPKSQQDAMVGTLGELGWTDEITVNLRTSELWAVGDRGVETMLDGHMRAVLAYSHGEASVPTKYLDLTPTEEKLYLATHDPVGQLFVVDKEQLDKLLREVSSSDVSVQQMLADLAEKSGLHYGEQGTDVDPEQAHRTLAERFIVPPFSVLDARQGYWQERKRAWLALGIQSELGRGECITCPGDAITESGLNYYRNANKTTLGAIAPNEGGDDGILASPGKYTPAKAAPGGSPRDAASLSKDGHTVRGDGHGRPIIERERESNAHGAAQRPDAAQGKVRRNYARCFGQDLMRGEHIVGKQSQPD